MVVVQSSSFNIQNIPDLLLVKLKYHLDLSSGESNIVYLSTMNSGHPFVNWDEVMENRINLNDLTRRLIKRAMDIVLSFLILLLLLTWIIPLIALFIKIDSAGSIFFLQKRKGFGGKSFTCLKFRSMYINDQSDITPVERGDPRITPFGKFLRKYYLDELPQFVNVLLGSMSIVGPRPHMLRENNYYEKVIKNYSFRYKVKPGITGLGQVNNRNQVSNREKMENRIFWDTLYIKNWSQYSDLWIIRKTFSLCIKAGNNFHSS